MTTVTVTFDIHDDIETLIEAYIEEHDYEEHDFGITPEERAAEYVRLVLASSESCFNMTDGAEISILKDGV